MKPIPAILSLFLLLSSGIGYCQVDTSIVKLAGHISSTDSTQQAPFVHVINTNTGRGVISDSLGYFKIKINRSDTLLFECMGFKDSYLNLPDSIESNIFFIEVSLSPTSYQLRVVDILALTRESQFRYDFTHLELEKDKWEQQLIIPGVTKENYQFIKEEEKFNPRQTFDGPISALYFQFSKEGKSLRKLAELLEEDKIEEVIDKKFNKTRLKNFTGYTGDTLDVFYKYIDFDMNYLHKTEAYDIYIKVSEKMKIFNKELNAGKVKIGADFD